MSADPENTREGMLAAAVRVHDLRFGNDHCDRRYILSCAELPAIILELPSTEPENTRRQGCTCGGRPDEIGGAAHRPGCGGSELPTVDLLTRAADAAGEAVRRYENRGAGSMFGPNWPYEIRGALGGPVGDLAALGGPDHWRAVEAVLRVMLKMHWREAEGTCDMCVEPFPCPTLGALRTLAEQVLRDLGDSHAD